MKRLLIRIVLVLLVVLVVIQVIPAHRTNPSVTMDIPTSPDVKAILRKACYDCHSNETVYPWYSRIAPVSWILAQHISEGREALNFSTWDQYSPRDQGEHIHESWETVAEGEMPPWYYTVIHSEARLSSEDRQMLRTWAREAPQRQEEKGEDNKHEKRQDKDE